MGASLALPRGLLELYDINNVLFTPEILDIFSIERFV